MSEGEFTTLAARAARRLEGVDRADAVAAACRGSADPAALAWLAEALQLSSDDVVVDVGSGLGGPAAWWSDRYGATVISLDASEPAVAGARRLFDAVGVVGSGEDPRALADARAVQGAVEDGRLAAFLLCAHRDGGVTRSAPAAGGTCWR